MPDYDVQFDSAAWDELDQFALLACQDYNYGNASNWFGSFRAGFHGVRSRAQAARRHFIEVHAWLPHVRIVADAEYHLATALFHMDSTVECMTFALNALGNAVAPDQFRNVTKANDLKKITPVDIIGTDALAGRSGRAPLSGYAMYFPELQAYMLANRVTIQQVMNQHDISKHRQRIFIGGSSRSDPPPDFFEQLGLAEGDHRRFLYSPMQRIVLDKDPKSRTSKSDPLRIEDQIEFEGLAKDLAECLVQAAPLALSDARRTISLKVGRLPDKGG